VSVLVQGWEIGMGIGILCNINQGLLALVSQNHHYKNYKEKDNLNQRLRGLAFASFIFRNLRFHSWFLQVAASCSKTDKLSQQLHSPPNFYVVVYVVYVE